MERFDVIVIGAGPGGYVAAIRAAQLGLRVACVEKNATLGGTCLNVGCIPSKALLDSSELFYLAKHRFGNHGIRVGNVELDVPGMLARKNAVVKGLTDGVAFLLRKNHVATFTGHATLTAPGQVLVKAAKPVELSAKSIILATGSEPMALPFLPFDGQHVVSSTEALTFDKVPQHLIVVGGGYIGLELGSVWQRLGAKVSVVEFLPLLLPLNDRDAAATLTKALQKQGLELLLGTKVIAGVVNQGQISLELERDGTRASLTGDRVLVAIGRKPYTADLGLDKLGIKTDERGRVILHGKYETSAPGVYAIGDMVAGPMLAHKASEEGIAVAENLAGKPGHVNYAAIPSVIYTHPEVAAVGLTEEEAKQAGKPYRVGKFPFAANGRAKALDDTEGFVKVISEQGTDRVLGVHIVGPRASDLIAECVLALEFHATAEDIARTCHGHPTLGEAVGEAARGAWTSMIQG